MAGHSKTRAMFVVEPGGPADLPNNAAGVTHFPSETAQALSGDRNGLSQGPLAFILA